MIAIDGAGYGDDGNIWGGEVLYLKDDGSYDRVAHLEYHKMIGGDLATIYPARMLFSILSKSLDNEYIMRLFRVGGYMKYLKNMKELELLERRYPVEKIYTSSLGRILDAYSVLLKVCGYRSYEGEPAMKLEAFSYGGSLIKRFLNLIEISERDGPDIIETSNIFSESIYSLLNGLYNKRDLAYTMQYILGYKLGERAIEHAKLFEDRFIYISGGAAVNDIILKGIEDISKENNIILRLHKSVPPGDGGISLGQMYSTSYLENIL